MWIGEILKDADKQNKVLSSILVTKSEHSTSPDGEQVLRLT